MKYWEIIADRLSKPVGAWAWFQPLILRGERSGLLMRTATHKPVIVGADEMLTAFLELKSSTGDVRRHEITH